MESKAAYPAVPFHQGSSFGNEGMTNGQLMTSFNASEAKSQFYRVLETADVEGRIHIQHRDGRQYFLSPTPDAIRLEGHFKPMKRFCMLDVLAIWQTPW